MTTPARPRRRRSAAVSVRRAAMRLLLVIFADRRRVSRNEVILWLFGLGWLRVAYGGRHDRSSLVSTVIDPSGAGTLARVVVVALAVLGALALSTRRYRLRVAHMTLAAAWWSIVWVLTYLQATPVPRDNLVLQWLPVTTTAYSYAAIMVWTISEAIHLARRTPAQLAEER